MVASACAGSALCWRLRVRAQHLVACSRYGDDCTNRCRLCIVHNESLAETPAAAAGVGVTSNRCNWQRLATSNSKLPQMANTLLCCLLSPAAATWLQLPCCCCCCCCCRCCLQLVRPEPAGRAGEGFAPVQVVRSFSLIPQKVMLGRDRRPVSGCWFVRGWGGVHGDTCGTLVTAVEERLFGEGSGARMGVGGWRWFACSRPRLFEGRGVSCAAAPVQGGAQLQPHLSKGYAGAGQEAGE
jgi:hypothetical protein